MKHHQKNVDIYIMHPYCLSFCGTSPQSLTSCRARLVCYSTDNPNSELINSVGSVPLRAVGWSQSAFLKALGSAIMRSIMNYANCKQNKYPIPAHSR